MATILDLLAQGTPSESDYLADNPFMMAGRGLSQIQVQPRTSSEAWWMPAVQGGLSGLLGGYGRASARDSQFQDTKVNPLITAQLKDPSALEANLSLAAYLSESAPESWSPRQAKTDVLSALLTQQAVQDQQAEKAKLAAQLKAKIEERTNPELQAAEAAQIGLNEAAKAANTPVKPVVIPAASEEKLAASSAAVDEMRALASDVENKSWKELKLAQNISAADTSGIGLRIRNLTDVLGKARSGASLNATEEKAYKKMIAGDFSADGKVMASTLRKLADTESKMALKKIETFGGGDNYKKQFSVVGDAPIITKTLKDGTQVKVRSIGGGKYEQVG